MKLPESAPGGTAPWRPAGSLEERLLAARQGVDQPGFLLALAGARLLLPVPAAPADGWVVSMIGGRTCVLAFTSPAAMLATGLDDADTVLRAAGAGELAARWPGPEVSLAVDPGLPIEAYLDAASVADLAALAAQPATAAEARLTRALAAGDLAAYLDVLLPTEVYLPLAGDPHGAGLREPGFPWLRLVTEPATGVDQADDDEAPVVVFTSRERLADAVGPRSWLHLPFGLLVDACPDQTALAVDPGLAHGARLDGALLRQLREKLRKVRRTRPTAGQLPAFDPD